MPDTESCSVYIACGGSVQGARHIRDQIPCEDAWAQEIIPGCLVIAVADGLSSAEYGGKGAEIAVSSCVRTIAGILNHNHDSGDQVDMGSVIRDGVGEGRAALASFADSEEQPISSYATTLLVAILKCGTVWCGHIGDGACVIVTGEEVSILSAPGNAEYANETAVLTETSWEKQLRIFSGEADAILLATDGCQGALIQREAGKFKPYCPFIVPLVKALLRFSSEGRDCNAEITDLLCSDRMRALSSDDMTLMAGLCIPGESV